MHAQVYIVPYLIVNLWLVMITLLQHTHPSLPHYNDSEWEWLRGALSTVDRSYGPLDVCVPPHRRHPRVPPPVLCDAALPRTGALLF